MVRSYDPAGTRARLLEAAERLMLSKGFVATSVDEICREAGLTKGGFFHHFKSKRELGLATLEHFGAVRAAAMLTGDWLKRDDPLERVYGYLDGLIRMSREPDGAEGCLIGNFAQELSETHPEIRAACAERFDLWAAAFAGELEAAKRACAPGAPFDATSVARHLVAVAEGALVLAKACGDAAVVTESLEHYKSYVKGLLEGRPEKITND